MLCLIAGCASAPSQERATAALSAKIKREQAALSRQTAAQMKESRKLPSVDFEFDSVHLTPSAYPVLDKIAELLISDPYTKLIIEGHSDIVGSEDYNDYLAASRAMAVKSYLVSRGVYPDTVTVYSYGSKRPLTRDDSPAGRALNRRVEFRLTDRTWKTVF